MGIQDAVRAVGLGLLLAASTSAWAGPLCSGGTVISHSTGGFVGCMFPSWGAGPASMCNGATVLPTGGGCYVCIVEPYATQLMNGNTSGFTPNDFSCLKCARKPTGSVGWWSFDEDYEFAYDLSAGVNYNDRWAATYNGGYPAPGKVQRSIQLDGVDDYVEVDNHAALNFGTGPFSFESWIKVPSTASAGSYVLLDKRVSSPAWRGYTVGLYSQKLLLQLADGSYYNYLSTGTVPTDGNWHHVAVTVNRTSTTGIQFYVDGVAAGSANPTARTGSLDNTSALRFGSRSQGGVSGQVQLGLDEASLYNRVLTPTEVQSIYNAGQYGACKNHLQPNPWW
ncbi:LamG domain-containing protein [Archangium sp.]|jgi:hypothetical protein|uniref:LamG domain-containing protein n=1 Tax=Archangium sp. TaxID=1872627 RepID=UPI002ED8FCD1